jgi:hypothetical protein
MFAGWPLGGLYFSAGVPRAHSISMEILAGLAGVSELGPACLSPLLVREFSQRLVRQLPPVPALVENSDIVLLSLA